MARIEHIKARLERWGAWSQAGGGGGLGYPKSSAFTRYMPKASMGTLYVPAYDAEAIQTERAVQALLPKHVDLWHTVKAHHALGFEVVDCAQRLGCSRAAVKDRLCRVDRLIEAWLDSQRLASNEFRNIAANV